MAKALTEIEKWVETNKKYQITTPNSEQVVLAQKDYRFRRILNESDLRIADGVGVVWAARLLGKREGVSFSKTLGRKKEISPKSTISSLHGRQPTIVNKFLMFLGWRPTFFKRVPKGNVGDFSECKFQRLAGIDLMVELSKMAAQKSWRVFLLGGRSEDRSSKSTVRKGNGSSIAQKAAQKLQKINLNDKRPFAKLTKKRLGVRVDSGSKNIKKESKAENEKVVAKINNFKPHFLFVAYGAPSQEKWIYDNLPKLDVRVAMGVGGAFDYLAGKTKRAPVYIRKLGFEWGWRLICQPWRVKRQVALAKFVWLVLKEKLLNG